MNGMCHPAENRCSSQGQHTGERQAGWEGGRGGGRGRTCRTMSVFPLGSGTIRATVMVEFLNVLETKRS